MASTTRDPGGRRTTAGAATAPTTSTTTVGAAGLAVEVESAGTAATGPLGDGVGRTTGGPGATEAARRATAPATRRTTAPAPAASRHEIRHRMRRRETVVR